MIVLGHAHPMFGSFGLATAVELAQGVSFFFVLSGFILAFNYSDLATWAERKHFYVARFARVWPAHAVSALLFIIVVGDWASSFHGIKNVMISVSNILLLHAWLPEKNVFLSLNGVSWSLSVEAFFYLLFPFLIIRWPKSWYWKMALSFLLVVLGIVFVNVVRPPIEPQEQGISAIGLLYIDPAMRLFEFSLGIATFFLYRALRAPWGLQTRRQTTFLEIFSMLAIVVALKLCDSLAGLGVGKWIGQGGLVYMQREGASVAFAFLILCFAMNKGLVSELLSRPFLVFLGEISFSLYLVHTIVLSYFETYEALLGGHKALWYLVYWGVCLGLSYLMHVVVERPFRRMIVNTYEAHTQGRSRLDAGRASVWRTRETIALGVLVGGIATAVWAKPSALDVVEDVRAERAEFMTSVKLGSQPIVFNDALQLEGIGIAKAEGESTELTFLWRTLRPVWLDANLGMHLVDRGGYLTKAFEFPLDRTQTQVAAATRWKSTIRISTAALRDANAIGLLIYKDPAAPVQSRGENTDWDGKRALFDVAGVF